MIVTIDQLETCLGATPKAVGLKVLDAIDSHAEHWLAASPLMFVGVDEAPDGMALCVAGGQAGFARAAGPGTLVLPLDAVDKPASFIPGQAVGLLSLVPGLGETLRINGRTRAVRDDSVEIEVLEVFLHCAKALIRSDFWQASRREEVPGGPAFLNQARFIAVATSDGRGNADVSPKGDPAGALLYCRDGEVGFGERPGNRRKDSLKNLLSEPRIAMLAVIPGAARVATVTGTARLTDDVEVCTRLAVVGKTPRLVTAIPNARINVRDSPALARVGWPVATTAHGIDPAAVFTDHIKRSKQSGIAATLTRGLLSKKLMSAELARDYRKKLY